MSVTRVLCGLVLAGVAITPAGAVSAADDDGEVSTSEASGDNPVLVNYPKEWQADAALKHSFSLSPGLQAGQLTSCIRRDSNVNGRRDLCRIVLGYDEEGDQRDWIFDAKPFADDGIVDRNVLAVTGTQSDGVGPNKSVVTANGWTYEGCYVYLWNGNWRCDYRTRRHTVLETSGEWDYVLRKMWNWSLNQGSNLGCAGGIAGIWYGGVVTIPLLTDCVDGPL